MYYYYDKKTNVIKMISEDKIKAPNLKYTQKDFSEDDVKKIKSANYETKIINGKLKAVKLRDSLDEILIEMKQADSLEAIKNVIKKLI